MELDSLVALEKLDVSAKGKYVVLVYFVTSQAVIEKEDIYGAILVVGTCANKKLATDMANDIIRRTGYRGVIIIKACQWHFLKPEASRDQTKTIIADRDRMFEQQAVVHAGLDIKYKEACSGVREAAFEHHRKILDSDCVENYQYQLSQIAHLEQTIESATEKMEQLQTTINQQLLLHPEFIES
uniref:Uncharacterized protein n=1 Tax=Pithovirus LCPAC103 TaxID=2506588 RepID=A0A481Z3G4_9VIRU|nr:MAG: uncharacterized protein LCPAC103_00750 [Pithovirus LCPAC103]